MQETYILKYDSSIFSYTLYHSDGITAVTAAEWDALFGVAGTANFRFSNVYPTTNSISIQRPTGAIAPSKSGASPGRHTMLVADVMYVGTWNATSSSFTSFTRYHGNTLTREQLSFLMGKIKASDNKIGGDLSNLTTTDKTSLINAINELVTSVDAVTLRVLGEDETYSVSTSAWTALTGKTPYNYSTDLTATHIIGANTIVELLNTDPVTFANNGIVIGEINGQTVTIYSVGVPASNLSLKINYKER